MAQSATAEKRPVRLIAVGGTIAMRGERAVPALDAAGLLAELPGASALTLEAETAFSVPGPQLSLGQALEVARRAVAAADAGEGVVITTGTDTMEEVAILTAMIYGGEAPIVLTGANRPASSPGADGPANLLDAVALAASPDASGLGVVVVFGGEIHASTSVRKVDSTGPSAFGSPGTGPVGRIVGGRVWIGGVPIRPTRLPVARLEHRVAIVTAMLGDDGEMLRRAAEDHDGIVLVALGAGHVSPAALPHLRRAAEQLPVLVTCRPERGSMMFETYGFEGAESDVRAAGAVCVPFLSPQAARIALLCCLGAGLDRDAIAVALAPWDAA
jgi:L-asparaginase